MSPLAHEPELLSERERRDAWSEIALVLLLSIGASSLRSLLNLVNSLTRPEPLANQTAKIIVSQTPDRAWLDLLYQLLGMGLALVPVLLVGYLLYRSGQGGLRALGFDTREPVKDIFRGVALAALVGGVGLVFYVVSFGLGINLRVSPVDVNEYWWSVPMLLLSAAQNSVLEEVITLGFLMYRLRQLRVAPWLTIAASALLRGAYHLYQGFGGFIGNMAMGLLFGLLYRRWGRIMPMVVAHFLIDAVAFVGYFLLRDHLSWLP